MVKDAVPVSSPSIPEMIVLSSPLARICFFSTYTTLAVMSTLGSLPARSPIFFDTAFPVTNPDSSPPNFRLIARLADSISTPYSLTYLSSSSMSSFSVTFSSSTLFSSSTWGVSSSLFILPTLLLRGGLGQPPVFPIEGSLNKFLQGVTESRSPSRCRRFGGSIPKVTFK
ncbi:hypothetical protein SDC9_132691 [bioreactor metagenome]|uniref:Uncharacterized protein n=1 Tax=bioreactor metagenome TaxID=1076179 RepID=A0A645D7W0_9ZZZZ